MKKDTQYPKAQGLEKRLCWLLLLLTAIAMGAILVRAEPIQPGYLLLGLVIFFALGRLAGLIAPVHRS